ncbi:diguanylate cyclase [Breoghania sp.]|uniref:sensor domain-containing diguanylate cyclase n=1 Tax=Breoghania sp. TaxID=2065378 RepID=UPI002AA7E363|nr:diguanylate cyclase [Breoghania sp.]
MFEASDLVRIVIISGNDALQRAIGGLNHSTIAYFYVMTARSIRSASSRADIAIVCGDVEGREKLRSAFPTALIVWLASAQEMAHGAAGLDVDEVWTAPMQPEELALRLNCLLNRHLTKQRNDFYAKALGVALNNLPDLFWIKSHKGTHLKVNDAFCDCVGKTRVDIEGFGHHHVWGLTKEEYDKSDYVCVDTDEVVIATKQPGVFDELVMSARGLRQFKTYKSPILGDAGEFLGTVGIARDITDLRNIDAKLKIVLNGVPFALLVTDETGRAIHTNPKFEEIFRVDSEAVLGHPIDVADLVTIISRQQINNGTEEEILIQAANDEPAQIVIKRADILDIFDHVVGTLNIYIDVTRSRAIDQKLKEMAYTDELTGLYTRHYLFHELAGAVKADSLALLSLDLDNFKSVNDRHGHAAGDHLLKRVGRIMREVFPDALCVRLGGDEFLVAQIGDVDPSAFTATAHHLLNKLKTSFASSDHTSQVSSSGGIAFSECLGDENFDSLLSKSDHALYAAKRGGKGQIVVQGCVQKEAAQ